MNDCIHIIGFDILYKKCGKKKVIRRSTTFQKPKTACIGDTFKLDYKLDVI